ncbi:MAG TPA: tyrosine-type recombinase/integrase [Polyangiaceae bacterium]|nr:tyrosine-type recombinase/integrase [Polyangiaceae bacterium]
MVEILDIQFDIASFGTMAREATGTWFQRGSAFYARLSIGGGKRESFALPTARNERQAEQQTKLLAELVKTLRKHGHEESCERLVSQAAKGAREFQQVSLAVEQLCAGETEPIPSGAITFREWTEKWLSGELATLYPGQLPKPPRRPAPVLGRYKNYIFPIVGEVPLVSFTLEHGMRVLRALPEHLSADSRRQIAVHVSGPLTMAAKPVVHMIDRNPLPRGFIPERSAPKARGWIYPQEDEQLLACKDVPLCYRVFYGWQDREGTRSEEARSLQWQDLDLELGTVSLDKNKTDDPRAWALSDGMKEALSAWREISPADNKGPTGYVFVDEQGRPMPASNLADRFRGHLKAANIKRDLLFKSSGERKQIVLHDLRATMITLNLAHGKNEAWIMDRTGHKSSAQIQAYRREVALAVARKLPPLRPSVRRSQSWPHQRVEAGRKAQERRLRAAGPKRETKVPHPPARPPMKAGPSRQLARILAPDYENPQQTPLLSLLLWSKPQ